MGPALPRDLGDSNRVTDHERDNGLRVECQDPGDCTSDVIINLPAEVLLTLRLVIGDQLSFELIDELIALKPVREALA